MNVSLLGSAIAMAILGARGLRKYQRFPLQRPVKNTPSALADWLLDREYIMYSVLAFAFLIAALVLRD